MSELRADFVERIKAIPIEKEPHTEDVELTEDEINRQLRKYKELLKNSLQKRASNKEEGR